MENCHKVSGKAQYVRCLKCNKIISCPRHDTSKLIDHIRTDHPEVCIIDSRTESFKPRAIFGKASFWGRKCGDTQRSTANKQKGPADCTPQCDNAKSRQGYLFRTSIEQWRPARGVIYCPSCGCKKKPIIKLKNERLSGNSCAANCLLACWPFCFLPFLVPGSDKEYLYCENCNTFLGLYDRSANCIRPNRQFSERTSGQQAKQCAT